MQLVSLFCTLKSHCFEFYIFAGHFVYNASFAGFSFFFFNKHAILLLSFGLHCIKKKKKNRKLILSLNFFPRRSDSQ